ncbi:MAG: efflux RND transporter periplasmic adaptor subunit [Erythrobacter sp.]
MNYETSITSEAADSMASDLDYGQRSGGDTRRRLMIIGGVLLALLIALAAAYFMNAESAPVAAGDDDSQLSVVTVVAPGKTSIAGLITASGTIAARRELPVGVAGEGGRVVTVPVDAGDWVRKGQVLAVIDRSVQSQQLRGQAAQVEVAKADADLAQSNLDRSLQLVERGFVSQADVDRLTATRDSARARVDLAQAQYSELTARNARLNIVAPEAGLLLTRNVDPGQTVSAGSGTLFRIAKGGEMEMLVRVSESQMADLSPGKQAEVTPTGSDTVLTGQIWQVSPVIDPQDRQGTVRVALSYAPDLRPGGFATARINSGTIVAPILPESAILSDKDGDYVFVVDAEDKAQRRDIETGLIAAEGIVIVDGLDGSEKIVLRAGGFLTEGEKVKPNLQGAAEG